MNSIDLSVKPTVRTGISTVFPNDNMTRLQIIFRFFLLDYERHMYKQNCQKKFRHSLFFAMAMKKRPTSP
jgi:hypothetical protein